ALRWKTISFTQFLRMNLRLYSQRIGNRAVYQIGKNPKTQNYLDINTPPLGARFEMARDLKNGKNYVRLCFGDGVPNEDCMVEVE
ncbi:MAG: hypothetical protein NC911_10545, partial [Candidatus Omnitrophica bacterium]|nr:hypothetical protein [Candidatus Omnitrophota bacterium]